MPTDMLKTPSMRLDGRTALVTGWPWSRATCSIICIYMRMPSPSLAMVWGRTVSFQNWVGVMPIDGMKLTSCMLPRARVPSKS